jgi:hypothetical protein
MNRVEIASMLPPTRNLRFYPNPVWREDRTLLESQSVIFLRDLDLIQLNLQMATYANVEQCKRLSTPETR